MRKVGAIGLGLSLWGGIACEREASPGPAATSAVSEAGSAAPAAVASPAGSAAPVTTGPAWVKEAPDFDRFFSERAAACTQFVTVEELPDGWVKTYEVMLPALDSEAVEKAFGERATELGLEVQRLLGATVASKPDKSGLGAMLAPDRELVAVTVPMKAADVAAEVRGMLGGAPAEYRALVTALGGEAAAAKARAGEGPERLGDFAVDLTRSPKTDEAAVASAAKKSGLVKGTGGFVTPDPKGMAPWLITLFVEEDALQVFANGQGPPAFSDACKPHPSRIGKVEKGPGRLIGERGKKADDDLEKEFLGE